MTALSLFNFDTCIKKKLKNLLYIRKIKKNACLIHFAGKEYKYFIGDICNKNWSILHFTLTSCYCKEFYQKVADLLDVKIQTKFLNIFQLQNVAFKKRIIKTLETHLLKMNCY